METTAKEKEKVEVPTLTLDDEAPTLNAMVGDAKNAVADTQEMQEQHFTEAEQKQIDEFAEKIDLNNMDQIMTYGASAQKKSANFS